MRSTRVLLVDGNAALRTLLAELLADEPGFHLVGQVARARQALSFLERSPVDVVVVAEHLDDVPGSAVLSRVRDACPEAVIALWADPQDADSGSADVLLDRGGSFRELVQELRHSVRTARRSTQRSNA